MTATAERAAAPADATLLPLLERDAVPMETLHERYGPVLELVRALIGVVPNCDPYLEIWPAAFRTYNVMVPNFLNLPFSLFGVGGAPKEILGLGMYVASRAAECPYCSAHCCSFALRRGTSPETIAQALLGGEAELTSQQRATIAVARSLGRVPCELTDGERDALQASFSPAAAEWVVFGIVMMGFLNKFMDAVGVELEQSTYSEVASVMGADWTPAKSGAALDPAAPRMAPPKRDSLWRKLRLVPRFPAALRLDSHWQRGVPDAWPAVGGFLRERTGHDFPVLSRIRARRCIRAVATMLRDNLDPATSVIGLEAKVLAGVVFATVIADEPLRAEMQRLAARNTVADDALDAAIRFASNEAASPPGADPARRALLRLARAASPSPARITSDVVEECRRVGISAAAVIEVMSWLSVLQMLHRLTSYFPADSSRAKA